MQAGTRGRADASKTLEIREISPRRRGDLEREFEDNVAKFIIPEYLPAMLRIAMQAGRNSKFRNGFLE
jgi:hypothetical protein